MTSVGPLLLGLAAGFAGGLFGVGGGVLIVPGLVLWLGLRQHEAHGTSVAAIVAMAAASAARFALGDAVEVTAALWLFVGAGVGAYAGARLAARVSEVWLARGFVVLALISAVRLGLAG